MSGPLGRAPSAFEVNSDRGFRGLTRALVWLAVLLIVVIVVEIGNTAWRAVYKYGPGFVVRNT